MHHLSVSKLLLRPAGRRHELRLHCLFVGYTTRTPRGRGASDIGIADANGGIDAVHALRETHVDVETTLRRLP